MEDWDISKPLASLPSINLTRLGPGISFLLPLSRRGHGPGLILLVPNTDHSLDIIDGVPSPLIKWAEEGYSVVEVQEQALAGGGHDAFTIALDALVASKDCDNGKIGLIGTSISPPVKQGGRLLTRGQSVRPSIVDFRGHHHPWYPEHRRNRDVWRGRI